MDVVDLSAISANWMMDINNEGVDKKCELSGDDVIDLYDLMEVVENWLENPF